MSIVLGLNCNHADSSACIIKDGKLLFAIEEERLNRVKHWAGLPVESIKCCLENLDLNISDIVDITINTNPKSNLFKKSLYLFKNYIFGKKKFEIYQRLKKKYFIIEELNNYFFPDKISKNVKINYIDHHLSHIASAYFPSGFDKAIGLSIDGFGDFVSLAIAKCNNNNIEFIKKIYFPDSLGVLYEAFTQLSGFEGYGDEYKFMGLSSYGTPIFFDEIKKNLFIDYKNLKLNLKYFNHTNKNFVYKFEGSPKQPELLNNKICEIFNVKSKDEIKNNYNLKKDIAKSVQSIFEEKILQICSDIKKMNYSDNLVYAGGCALNSLANKKIIESKIFENIFIPYAPGDGGGSIGSALYFLNQKKQKVTNLKTPFLGNDFSNAEIEREIKKENKLNSFKIVYNSNQSDLNEQIVNLIYENKIVGYFQGKMEFGARALGNRSILANPCEKNIKDIINLKIKRRESFRPFAPAIIENEKSNWFKTNFKNPYMSAVESILEKKRDLIPAVTHVDGTGRVQTVSKDLNPKFFSLIEKFCKISGVPILLNTSFNENEPIVNKPSEAIECFLRTKMDVLVLENYIIMR
ncbi:carbamoyltransferase [Candidatus Pelagibacter sp.]|nr:carbamoyltransferase [Candidatus Pelagibacter sp.]